MTMANYANARRVRKEVAELIKPPNRQPISQSARELLRVEQNGSMVPYDAELVPYMHEPMDCLKSRLYDAVIFAGPARTAKTVSLVDAWVVDTIVNDPADFLLVQISEDKAREFSKKRLSRAFHASPKVRARMSDKAHDNNVHDKVFKSGNFLKVGWPSKNIFASSDWKRVALTDYDRMKQDIDGEGSGFTLAGKRTQTFMSSGMVMAESSPGFMIVDPTYRVKSKHEAPPTTGILSLYNQGDRRLYYWQCTECGEWFEPDFSLFEWDKSITDPATASRDVVMACPHCGSFFREDQRMPSGSVFKHDRNTAGHWVPQGCHLDQNGQLHGTARPSRFASFWQKGPTAAFQTWEQILYKYLAAMREYELTGDLESLKSTVNTDQGHPFTPPNNQDRSMSDLMERTQDLGVHVVPTWVRFLTASVDVQGGKKTARFDVLVLGWGVDLESIVIDRFAIHKSRREDPNNPDKFVRVNPATHLEDWDLVREKVIERSYPLDDNTTRRMPVTVTACDSGGEDGVTDNAYEFWRQLKRSGKARRFMLIKGRATGIPVEKRYPDNTSRSDRKAKISGDVPVFFLNTNRLKDTVDAALERAETGRRYVHLPDWLPESFFEELNAEERGTDGKWHKISPNARNETFDLFVYNWAAVLDRKAETQAFWENPPSWARPIDENSEILSNESETVKLPTRRRRRASV